MAATIVSIALAISGTSPWDNCEVLRGGVIVHWHTVNHLVRLDKGKNLTKNTQKTQRKLKRTSKSTNLRNDRFDTINVTSYLIIKRNQKKRYTK